LAKIKSCRSEVGWVIRSEGQPDERPDPKKPTDSCAPGSSLIVSDYGLSRETGDDTDFVVVMP